MQIRPESRWVEEPGPALPEAYLLPIPPQLARQRHCLSFIKSYNAAYQEQGSTVLDLLKGFKEAFVEADAEGKARILQVLLKKATLRGKEWEFEFAQPFDVLFSIGELYFKKRMWGAFAVRFIKVLWRNNLAPQLEELINVAREFCPGVCPVGGTA